MMWEIWNKKSVRKPLAFYSVLFCYILCALAFWLQLDIPSGAVTILSFVVPSIVGSYFASSTAEAIKCKGKTDKVNSGEAGREGPLGEDEK